MRELAFRIVNVFTKDRGSLTGNPLCVFESGTSLDTATMQALARQFNLSETTFVLPSSRATAQVRIFTPSYEMPFAGHPTLGTAHVCRALGLGADDLKLEMQAGIIPVRADGDRWTLQANAPTWRKCEASRGTLAKMLGVAEGDIGTDPLWIKAGKEQLVVPLTSERAVRSARPDPATFAGVLSEDGHAMAYVFAELAQPGRLLSRFFFPVGGAIDSVRFPSSSSTVQPSMRSSFAIVRTSASCGTFFHSDAPLGSSAAANSGSAAFFAPLIGIFPARRAPPSTTILSIGHSACSTQKQRRAGRAYAENANGASVNRSRTRRCLALFVGRLIR